ncbi:unnamed protein product [Brassica rapa]|uniref:Uncharacterized protein n=2 Tax=Brassica TaxID=3705 RepID=A0A3P6B5Z6_BRACM|nr:unnamed protein product [Brassica napus]CAG7901226.1 unnamed protein product [Brassica rapa]VDC96459.1 unnamed protein product [Brassica rapa]
MPSPKATNEVTQFVRCQRFEQVLTLCGLHEVINGASDRGITLLRVSALKGHIETVQLLLDWELLLLRSLWKMEPQEIL